MFTGWTGIMCLLCFWNTMLLLGKLLLHRVYLNLNVIPDTFLTNCALLDHRNVWRWFRATSGNTQPDFERLLKGDISLRAPNNHFKLILRQTSVRVRDTCLHPHPPAQTTYQHCTIHGHMDHVIKPPYLWVPMVKGSIV